MSASLRNRIASLETRDRIAQAGCVVLIYDANVSGDLDRQMAGAGTVKAVICIPDNGRPRYGIINHDWK